MKLATIEKITKLSNHPNADRLELIQVLGYQAVVPIGLHKEGDLIVYIQPDTVLPKDQEWAEEYIKYSPKRVKCVRLRGEFSEGVVVPLSKWGLEYNWINDKDIGLEISDAIGVVKYDPPLPKNENVVGGLPYGLGRTDEERFENLIGKLPMGEFVDVTLKIDGMSSTHGYYLEDDKYLLTGRRYEINPDEENRYSIHIPKIKDKIITYCKLQNVSLAFRGESYGKGIQGNKNNIHSTKPKSLAVFSIYNLDKKRYEHKGSEYYYAKVCAEIGIETVEMLEENVILTNELIDKYSKGLKKLPNGNSFEGVVIKHKNGSFKIINKYYDAKK